MVVKIVQAAVVLALGLMLGAGLARATYQPIATDHTHYHDQIRDRPAVAITPVAPRYYPYQCYYQIVQYYDVIIETGPAKGLTQEKSTIWETGYHTHWELNWWDAINTHRWWMVNHERNTDDTFVMNPNFAVGGSSYDYECGSNPNRGHGYNHEMGRP